MGSDCQAPGGSDCGPWGACGSLQSQEHWRREEKTEEKGREKGGGESGWREEPISSWGAEVRDSGPGESGAVLHALGWLLLPFRGPARLHEGLWCVETISYGDKFILRSKIGKAVLNQVCVYTSRAMMLEINTSPCPQR